MPSILTIFAAVFLVISIDAGGLVRAQSAAEREARQAEETRELDAARARDAEEQEERAARDRAKQELYLQREDSERDARAGEAQQRRADRKARIKALIER